jgi:hypothetical protein
MISAVSRKNFRKQADPAYHCTITGKLLTGDKTASYVRGYKAPQPPRYIKSYSFFFQIPNSSRCSISDINHTQPSSTIGDQCFFTPLSHLTHHGLPTALLSTKTRDHNRRRLVGSGRRENLPLTLPHHISYNVNPLPFVLSFFYF